MQVRTGSQVEPDRLVVSRDIVGGDIAVGDSLVEEQLGTDCVIAEVAGRDWECEKAAEHSQALGRAGLAVGKDSMAGFHLAAAGRVVVGAIGWEDIGFDCKETAVP